VDSIDLFIADVAKADRTLARINAVAAATGINPKTLRNLYYGETVNPRRNNVRALDAFYAKSRRPAREAA
jgi:hypothetical protein